MYFYPQAEPDPTQTYPAVGGQLNGTILTYVPNVYATYNEKYIPTRFWFFHGHDPIRVYLHYPLFLHAKEQAAKIPGQGWQVTYG